MVFQLHGIHQPEPGDDPIKMDTLHNSQSDPYIQTFMFPTHAAHFVNIAAEVLSLTKIHENEHTAAEQATQIARIAFCCPNYYNECQQNKCIQMYSIAIWVLLYS